MGGREHGEIDETAVKVNLFKILLFHKVFSIRSLSSMDSFDSDRFGSNWWVHSNLLFDPVVGFHNLQLLLDKIDSLGMSCAALPPLLHLLHGHLPPACLSKLINGTKQHAGIHSVQRLYIVSFKLRQGCQLVKFNVRAEVPTVLLHLLDQLVPHVLLQGAQLVPPHCGVHCACIHIVYSYASPPHVRGNTFEVQVIALHRFFKCFWILLHHLLDENSKLF